MISEGEPPATTQILIPKLGQSQQAPRKQSTNTSYMGTINICLPARLCKFAAQDDGVHVVPLRARHHTSVRELLPQHEHSVVLMNTEGRRQTPFHFLAQPPKTCACILAVTACDVFTFTHWGHARSWFHYLDPPQIHVICTMCVP